MDALSQQKEQDLMQEILAQDGEDEEVGGPKIAMKVAPIIITTSSNCSDS